MYNICTRQNMCIYIIYIFFDTKIYKWRMFLHAVFRSHVKLSKESLMSNFPSNNIRLPSTGMDTQHVYQFNVWDSIKTPQGTTRTVSFFFSKVKGTDLQYIECHQSEEMEKPWHSCYVLGRPFGCVFVSWNAAHWWAPMVWCLQLSFFRKPW